MIASCLMKPGWVMPALLLGLLAASSGRAGVIPEARPMLDRLESAIEPIREFQADFVQVRHLALTDENVEATGRLRFLAPDHFRLDFKSPDADVLTMRGDSLLVYFAGLKQAQVYSIHEGEAARGMFLLFASRRGTLETKFDISLAPATPEGPALRFQPLEGALEYPLSEIWVYLNAKSGLPERLFFREEGGDTVVFRFDKVRTRAGLSPGDFVFVPPKGTEIIQR